jgi:aerobic carbon-monoxide dehydrogenase large subunit
MFGQRIKRKEDPALLRGDGRFADDIQLPGMLHAHFVRSPLAHARITGIDTAEALALDGVVAIYTLDDLSPYLTGERVPVEMPAPAIRHRIDPYVLAKDEVCHVGDPIALVIAESKQVAEDAAGIVWVDYDPLAACVDPRDALATGAPQVRADVADNLVAAFDVAYGNPDAAFATAPHVFKEEIQIHKGGGHAMECRALVADYDISRGHLTVWNATQMPHRAQMILTRCLGMAEANVRVVPPDVGGGFGPKFVFYSEEVSVPLASKLLGRPVKWIEDRREHFTATTQERDQFWNVEVAVDANGCLIGIRGDLVHDHGAYTPYGLALAQNSASNLLGPYKLPNYDLKVRMALTNLIPATPTRGAGRPQGTFVMERLLDRVARELKLDRGEVRRRNFISAEEMPYETPVVTRDGKAMTYDSGDYPGAQAIVLEKSSYESFEARREAARAVGKYLGFGLANYVEGTGRGPFESAVVRIGPSGVVTVETGATSQGQGIETALAQIAAAEIGVELADVKVSMGDTAVVPYGLGAFASRQAVTAGSSVSVAAQEVRAKTLAAASHMLEAAVGDLEIVAGDVRIKGSDRSLPIGDVAAALAGQPGYAIPGGLPPGLESRINFEVDSISYCNGSHACEVLVDPETGAVEIARYVVVHDCGRMINPTLVEGQIIGGVAHGIGNALMERMVYDPDGQPLTANYGEYLLPTAPEIPRIEIFHMESPTPLNPLGVKGTGESGTVPAAACIVSAIEDALAPLDFRIREAPITPMRIMELLHLGRDIPP